MAVGQKPMGPFWSRCTTHVRLFVGIGMFTGGTGFSPMAVFSDILKPCNRRVARIPEQPISAFCSVFSKVEQLTAGAAAERGCVKRGDCSYITETVFSKTKSETVVVSADRFLPCLADQSGNSPL